MKDQVDGLRACGVPAVICAVMPTPAYPHDHSPEQEKRRIDGKEYVYPDQLAWPGIATLPGLPSTAIPTHGFTTWVLLR